MLPIYFSATLNLACVQLKAMGSNRSRTVKVSKKLLIVHDLIWWLSGMISFKTYICKWITEERQKNKIIYNFLVQGLLLLKWTPVWPVGAQVAAWGPGQEPTYCFLLLIDWDWRIISLLLSWMSTLCFKSKVREVEALSKFSLGAIIL